MVGSLFGQNSCGRDIGGVRDGTAACAGIRAPGVSLDPAGWRATTRWRWRRNDDGDEVAVEARERRWRSRIGARS